MDKIRKDVTKLTKAKVICDTTNNSIETISAGKVSVGLMYPNSSKTTKQVVKLMDPRVIDKYMHSLGYKLLCTEVIVNRTYQLKEN